MTAPLREREGILNKLTLAVIVQYLVGVDKLSILLKHVDSREHIRVEPVLDLVISAEVCHNEILEVGF
jgi:hypothetical protein